MFFPSKLPGILTFFYRLLSFFLLFFLSFYISIDAFGLHIHIRLLKFCLPHWFPNAHWTPSLDQVHSAVEYSLVFSFYFKVQSYFFFRDQACGPFRART